MNINIDNSNSLNRHNNNNQHEDNNNLNSLNNNNNNEHSDNNSNLFLKVFRNIYLNKLIFEHLKCYKYAYLNFKHTIQSLKEFKYRSYLLRLLLIPSPIEDSPFMTLPKGIIPNCVERLVILKNVSIIEGDIPTSVQFLSLAKRFIQYPPGQIIPSNVKLTFGSRVNIDEDCVIPPQLEYLRLSKKDQCSILYNKVPDSLVNLSLGDIPSTFNHIPNSIKSLSFYGDFNKPLPSLPPHLEYLRIGHHFKKDIPQLPNTIKTIKIGRSKKFKYITQFEKYPNLTSLDCYVEDLVIPNQFMNRVVDFKLIN